MDDTGPHFFHRHALELVMPVGDRSALEPWKGAAPKLLGALRGHVNEQKPAGNGCRAPGLVRVALIVCIVFNHDHVEYLKPPERATSIPGRQEYAL